MRWALHPKLLPDELMSSWIKRISEEYLFDISTILNRPLRGLSYDGLDNKLDQDYLDYLSSNTGISIDEIWSHTFLSINHKFPKAKGVRKEWREGLKDVNRFDKNFILSIRRGKGRGIRYCPDCIKEEIPYFRMYWKLEYYQICHIHSSKLIQDCQECGSYINYFREKKNYICRKCDYDLRDVIAVKHESKIVNTIHSIFWDEKSPIPELPSNLFLGYLWELYSFFSGMELSYVDAIILKIMGDVSYDNGFEFNLMLMELSYNIVLERKDHLEEPIPCNLCNEWFKRKPTLSGHLVRHQEPKLKCKTCNELFTEIYELNRHYKVHQNGAVICDYCSAPFISETRLSGHLTKQYSDHIEKRIINAIEKIKENGEKLTYVKIANSIRLPRSLFNNHPRFKELVRVEQDLRTQYFSISKFPREEKIEIYKGIIKDAISRIKTKKKEISISSVAKEIGISRSNFDRYPTLKQLVNDNRTAVTFVNDDELFEEVKRAIKDMKLKKSPITLKSVAEWIGRDPETLTRRIHIKEYVVKHWINHHNGKLVKKIILNDVIPVVEKLKLNKEKISKRKVGMKLGKSADYLRKDPEINSYLEREIQLQRGILDQEMKDLIKYAIESIIDDTDTLSFRKVAKFIGVDIHRILENGEYKGMVKQAIKELDKEKVDRIYSAIESLKTQEKRVTFISVHRETGFPRSFIEQNEEIRMLITESQK